MKMPDGYSWYRVGFKTGAASTCVVTVSAESPEAAVENARKCVSLRAVFVAVEEDKE